MEILLCLYMCVYNVVYVHYVLCVLNETKNIQRLVSANEGRNAQHYMMFNDFCQQTNFHNFCLPVSCLIT
jgi:hypothetical protein